MSSKGKTWKWKADAAGRKAASESMTKRLKEGKVGRAFKKTHGLSTSREYNHHKKMMHRCYHEHNKDYVNYGGRGISVCERWHSVANFIEDMGEVPRKAGIRMSLERLDVNGNYEPDNCIWLPLRLQAKNRRPWKHTPEGIANISKATKARNLARSKKRESP